MRRGNERGNDDLDMKKTEGRLTVRVDDGAEAGTEVASRSGAILFSFVMFAFGLTATVFAFQKLSGHIGVTALVVSVLAGALVASAVHIAQQWEKVVVLRLGKLSRVSGPGIFLTIPIVESCALRVDGRMRTTTFGAEETLTSDLVPIDVDAVLFWMVWDARLACTEVEDFERAVRMSAQTALRDAIGRESVAEVAIRRNMLDRELKKSLEEKVAPWGITILSVEIRDILMSHELQEAMSLEAQAEQRKKARITLMEAEQDIADMLQEMGEAYSKNDSALQLRAMHLLYESVRETGGTVVVPSSFSEGFNDVFPDGLGSKLGKLSSK